MATYKEVYKWNVIDEIGKGKQVYMLDRQNQSVALINDMDAQSAIKIVNCKDNENRYDFWICEETEVVESEETHE